MKIVNKCELLRNREVLPSSDNTVRIQPDFATGIAAAEFGGRYWGWREWADHVDVEPQTLAEQRIATIWGDSK